MNKELSVQLNNLPGSPGVYLFSEAGGRLLYVGKAKDLKKRVSSYFLEKADRDPKTAALVQKIAAVSTIVTNSEAEALLLEDSLIKKHKPPYNIDLRDDKRYPYFRLSTNEEYPRLTIVRLRKKDGAAYFGPYAGSIAETLKAINKIFSLRKCNTPQLKRKTKPCVYFQIKQCLAPCLGGQEQAYQQEVSRLKQFLQGDYETLLENLKKDMALHAKNMEYEKAAADRDKIKALERLASKQYVIAPDTLARDIWHYAENPDFAVAVVINMQNGRITASRNFSGVRRRDFEEQYMERLLVSYYKSQEVAPQEIILPEKIQLTVGLSLLAQQGIKIVYPQSGFRQELLALAYKNALKLLQDKIMNSLQNKSPVAGLLRLKAVLALEKVPVRIDCFDVSHIQGSDTVAAMTVLRNGLPDKNNYRKYIIHQEKPNDIASMEEVLSRRYLKVTIGEQERPDLIIIDGGKGQLSIAKTVLKKFGLNIPLAALAKRNEELFVPNRLNPIVLKRSDPALRLIQTIRNEAHRFAISFHRQRRSKRVLAPQQ